MVTVKIDFEKHVKRIIKEKNKLDKKIYRAEDFYNNEKENKTHILDKKQFKLLGEQIVLMKKYSMILKERVEHDIASSVEQKDEFICSRIDIEKGTITHYTNTDEDKERVIKDVMAEVLKNAGEK